MSRFQFADSEKVQHSRIATEEIDPEVLDHIIQQTENFLNNLEVCKFLDENEEVACLPDGRPVNLREMKETFFKFAPDILIQLAYRVKYLQEKRYEIN